MSARRPARYCDPSPATIAVEDAADRVERLVDAPRDQPREVAATRTRAELCDDVATLARLAQHDLSLPDQVAPLAEVVERAEPVRLADVDLPPHAGAVIANHQPDAIGGRFGGDDDRQGGAERPA